MRLFLLGLAAIVISGLSFLGGAGPAVATTPPPSTVPTVAPPVFTDAVAVRDELLAIAQANLAEQARPQFNGFFDAWKTAYPGLRGGGSAVNATGDGFVSTSRGLLNSKNLEGPTNPTVIAFAVMDKGGKCAGAVLYGYPKTDNTMKIESPAPCNAQGVATAFAATFNATPPASTTVASSVTVTAPKPPATGSGLAADGDARVALGGALLALLGSGALVVLNWRRRD